MRRFVCRLALVSLLSCSLLGAEAQDADRNKYVVPKSLSKYQFATHRDTWYLRHLEHFIGDPGEPTEWTLFEQIKAQAGDILATPLDALIISKTITDAMSIEGQQAAKRIQKIVDDCAETLDTDSVEVWVKQSPTVNAYVCKLKEPHFLVLTSGLLELYEERPSELRFVIGHELGHIKCGHLKAHAVGTAVLASLTSFFGSDFEEKGLKALAAPLGLGFLLSWLRESEISADRAGLLCCQDQAVAEQALLRLLHGLKADSKWLDPKHPDFDPSKAVLAFQRWENEPLVSWVNAVRRIGRIHPFIPSRIVALREWAAKGGYRAILNNVPDDSHVLKFNRISLSELQEEKGQDVDPYCILYTKGKKLFELGYQEDTHNPVWDGINRTNKFAENVPIFIEVKDYDVWPQEDRLIGVAVVYPRRGQTRYVVDLERNVIDRRETINKAILEIEVEFLKKDKAKH